MVDNRTTGFYGVSGFNFKAGDASGMANKMTDDKMGQGGEYFAQEESQEEEFKQNEFVDRSVQLIKSLDSLALLNAANVQHISKEQLKRLKEDSKKNTESKKNKKNKKNLGHLIDDYEKK